MSKLFSILALIGLPLLIAGCGGGADAPTKVKIKPSTAGANDGAAKPGGNDSPVVAEGFGTIKGRVVLDGASPQLALLVKQGAAIKDAAVCAATDIPNEKLVVGGNDGVANVFIYLAKTPKGVEIPAPPSEPILFDQKGCQFLPHALWIRVGQPLQIVSGDPVAHNTNIQTIAGQGFNSIIALNDREGKTHVFDRQENQPVPVRCDFHAWMSAVMLPVDHPYVGLTDANGEFEIANVPAGTQKFKVWHEGAGYLNRNLTISVNADAVVDQEIKYPVSKFKP